MQDFAEGCRSLSRSSLRSSRSSSRTASRASTPRASRAGSVVSIYQVWAGVARGGSAVSWSFQVEEEEGGVRGRSLGDLRVAGRREPQVSRREAGEVGVCYRWQRSSRRGG